MNIKIADRDVGDGFPCFIIAEMGSNHNGSLNKAKNLIDVATEAGCDAVKIQIPRSDECYPPGTKFGGIYGSRDITEVIRENEIPPEWIPKLVSFAHEKGLLIGASTDGFIGLRQMLKGNVDFIKIPSFTISHIPLLQEAPETNKPWLLSTGTHPLGQIEEALLTVKPTPVAIFHCISAYPTLLEDLNLATIPFLKQAFGVPVGFSDHSTDPTRGPGMAVALGANMIEKHYTLDRRFRGTDHFFSLEPNELRDLVNIVRKIETDPEFRQYMLKDSTNKVMVGNVRKGIFDAEIDFHVRTVLGIYFLRDMKKGEKICNSDIRVFRCADTVPGLHPRYFNIIKDSKLVRAANAYEGIQWDHLIVKGAMEL
jgi:N-acetylneuraminate synthase